MKILKSNFDKKYAMLKVTNNDDLWYLKELIEEGDLIKSKTRRSIFVERKGKKIKTGKKSMVLKIQVEKIEFQKETSNLRLTGPIKQGPEDEVQLESYHTIKLTLGTVFSIEKEWKKYQIEILKKAQASVPQILIVAVDNESATFGILKKNRVKIIFDFKNKYSSKEEEKLPEFYKKIAQEISRYSEKVERIILAGPGFAKEHVKKILDNKKVVLENASSASEAGINEIIKKGILEKVVKESEILKETRLVNDFFVHLNKDDGLAVYGKEDIKKANEIGAIDTLLISIEKMDEIEDIAKDVEKKQGKVEIISKEHDLGEQFYKMGGSGAILRFRI